MIEASSSLFPSFIENLRISRNMSREEFLKDILSLRQYSRFLKGESEISNTKILQLSEKLGVNFFVLYKTFIEKTNTEHRLILKILGLVSSFNFEDAYNEIALIDSSAFASDYYKNFYNYLRIRTEYSLKRISRETAILSLNKISTLHSVKNNSHFNYVEIAVIIFSAKLKSEKKDYSDIKEVYNLLSNPDNYLFGKADPELIPAVYANLAQLLGIIDDYTAVIDVCERGIKICKENSFLNSLSHLYYYLSLAQNDVGMKMQAKVSASKCIIASLTEGSYKKTEIFITNLTEFLNTSFENLKKINEELKND